MAHVTMTHPSLPDQPIKVDEASVPHYQASGWQVVNQSKTTTQAAAKGRRRKGEG